jgi:hypothetical protein
MLRARGPVRGILREARLLHLEKWKSELMEERVHSTRGGDGAALHEVAKAYGERASAFGGTVVGTRWDVTKAWLRDVTDVTEGGKNANNYDPIGDLDFAVRSGIEIVTRGTSHLLASLLSPRDARYMYSDRRHLVDGTVTAVRNVFKAKGFVGKLANAFDLFDGPQEDLLQVIGRSNRIVRQIN